MMLRELCCDPQIFVKGNVKLQWQVCLDACRAAACDRHVSLMWTLSLQATPFAAVSMYVCILSICYWSEGGGSLGSSSPSRKWQRRQLNLCSVPPSLPPPSLTTPPLLYWRVWGQSPMNLNDPLETSRCNSTIYSANTKGCNWPFETRPRKSVNSKQLCGPPTIVLLWVSGRQWRSHAQWSTRIISGSWMSTMRPTRLSAILVHGLSKDRARVIQQPGLQINNQVMSPTFTVHLFRCKAQSILHWLVSMWYKVPTSPAQTQNKQKAETFCWGKSSNIVATFILSENPIERRKFSV